MRHFWVGFVIALACILSWKVAFGTVTNQTTQQRSALGVSTVTIGFPFLDNDYIRVFVEDTTVTPAARSTIPYGVGAGKFTITGGDPGTTVVMGASVTEDQRVVVQRYSPKTQTTDYEENAAFPFDDHEEQMDKTIMLIQELSRDVGQKIGLSTASSYSGLTIPDPSADRFLVYNHAGDDFTLAPTSTPATGDFLLFSGTGWSSVPIADYAGSGGGGSVDLSPYTLLTTFNAHANSTSNPHAVTSTQVGNTLDQWNASALRGVMIDATQISNGRFLYYNAGTSTIGYSTLSIPSGLPTLGAANTVLHVNSAGTDLSYDTLTDANIASNAAINRQKLGTSSANSVVTNGEAGGMSSLTAGSSGQVLIGNSTVDGKLKFMNLPGYQFYSDTTDSPTNSNWAVNNVAPIEADAGYLALSVAAFDASSEEGRGYRFVIPEGATWVKFTFMHRASTTPAGTSTIRPKVYWRKIGGEVNVPSWSNKPLNHLSIAGSSTYRSSSDVYPLSSFPWNPGDNLQMELTRSVSDPLDILPGDWYLDLLRVEFY